MKLFKLFLIVFLSMLIGGMQPVYAQTVVTAGNQVTDESNIVSGNAYLVYYVGNGNSGYMKDTGSAYTGKDDANPTESAVYYFTDTGSGTWTVKNYYTNNYWPVPPTTNGTSTTPSSTAGIYTLNFQSGGNLCPSAPDASSTTHSWNRSGSSVHLWSSGTANVNQFQIYEVDFSTATPFSDFTDKDLTVSSTAATSLTTGTWYVMSQRSRSSYVYEDASSHTLKHTQTSPSGYYAPDVANYFVRLVSGTDGKYYLQTGLGNYVGQITASTNVPTTALKQEQLTIDKIASTDGHFYVQSSTGGVILDANDFTQGDPATVVGWGTSAPTATDGNNDWAFYPVELVEAWAPTASEVYTINNTNTSRGAMIYYPSGSTTYVYSTGKGGTFDATDTNCQWVIYPIGSRQYYLYNVGAGKFAIPSGTASTASWIFSSDAVAVTLLRQSDGTYKIKTATTDTYAAVSNGYNGPIINYNDVGGNFTITLVDDADQSSAVATAVGKLADNQTALSAAPTGDNWYIIRIKTHGTYADKYVYPATSDITYSSTNYPLTFDHGANIRPAIDDVTYYTRIAKTDGGFNWQLPDGRYLYNPSDKFPVGTTEATDITVDYSSSGFRFYHNNGSYTRYAVPYFLSSQYFIGETSSTGNAYYDLYPIDLTAAGLTAWQVLCDNAPETAQITCSHSDVKGLTAVYKNGFFFLPTGVTPAESDFTLDGASGATIDGTAHTITFTYDPNLAIVADGVSVAQGWQTAGRDSEVMLLKVTTKPFKDATNVSLTVNLKDGSEANISTLKLYEADSASPEIYSTGTGAPTKTEVATVTVSGSTATFSIGNLSAGTHYYWIGAIVSSTATLGAVLDAAVTGIAYQVAGQTAQNLDLTSVGDPADKGATVFNVQNYPFLPWDNGSHVYRIPALITANDGSLLAACDKRYGSYSDLGSHKIDVVLRRSTDGGKTWGSPVVIAEGDGSTDAAWGYGDPTFVKTNSGKIICLMAAGKNGFGNNMHNIAMVTSDDNGVTWSSVVDITTREGHFTNNSGQTDFFVTSGKGLCTRDGVVMFLIDANRSSETNYVLYSVDEGENWIIDSNVVYRGGNEAKLQQANDNTLIASIRQGGNRGFNFGSYVNNGNGTLTFAWGTQYQNSQLNAGNYGNNQDILYYSRSSEGDKDILLHSMTIGQHANFNLYMSLDGGANWTQVFQVQSKGTRYVVMSKLQNGDLALLFEDQSLNAAGGYTDYNHYPINFLTITKEQIDALYTSLVSTKYPVTATVNNSLTGNGTGCNTWGAFSDTASDRWARTWTSNANSGVKGLTVTSDGYGFDSANAYYQRVMTFRPGKAEGTDKITITAPAGYVIGSYTITARNYSSSQTYQIGLDTDNMQTTSTSGVTLNANDVNASSTSFYIYGDNNTNNWLCITNFVITLKATVEVAMNVVGEKSYATLYLPYAVTLPAGTQAYSVSSTADGWAKLTEIETTVPASTPVILVNGEAASSVLCTMSDNAASYTDTNMLRGTLVSRTLDLAEDNGNYSLGRLDRQIGFIKYKNGTTTITLGANKAYLEVPASSSNVKGFMLDFGGEDGINQMVNGKSVNGTWYDLNGRRLSGVPAAKGVYIVGGKKVVVK